MAGAFRCTVLLVVIVLQSLTTNSRQLQSSQTETLLRLRQLLNFPAVLDGWNHTTDFCNTEPTPSLTIVCYEDSITQLHIFGDEGTELLPKNFSMDSFVTTLVKLPNVKVLKLVSLGLFGPLPGKISRLTGLEILNASSNFLYGSLPHELSSLKSLQTLILDYNMFSGQLPGWLGLFPSLAVLKLRNNMFNGSLPPSLSNLYSLRVLELSHNHFYGEVPNFSSLTNLQVLDLEGNDLGPRFPQLGDKLLILILCGNRFRSNVPPGVNSYYQLRHLDLSSNAFIGPFPSLLLSLPSISYLNISHNKFTGMLAQNLSCNTELEFVDLSSNLLIGSLPRCLGQHSRKRKAEYAENCLANENDQHPLSFCSNQALAVGILPEQGSQSKISKLVLALCITGGVIGGVILVGTIFLLVRRLHAKRTLRKPQTRLISVNASTGYTAKFLSDARYISQTMKLGALGLPAYRMFSLEELEAATNNFDTSAFVGEGSQGQMYRGQLKDGSLVAIRCLKMKKSFTTQSFMRHIELISKLRHRHLVSSLGHCFECYFDDSTVSRIFLVFEYVPNGTLRSWISEGREGRSLSWEQRITAAIGIAKGLQFLHTGIVPGVYANNLKITDVLLDSSLVAKIRSYNLPLVAENITKPEPGISIGAGTEASVIARENQEDKIDIYDFGVILLEIIVGRPLRSRSHVEVLRDQLQASIVADDAARRSMVDPTVHKACSDQSLKTMMEVCGRCLVKEPSERPSVEDVLWNLHFAAQVQEANRSNSPSSQGSPPQRVQITFDEPQGSGSADRER